MESISIHFSWGANSCRLNNWGSAVISAVSAHRKDWESFTEISCLPHRQVILIHFCWIAALIIRVRKLKHVANGALASLALLCIRGSGIDAVALIWISIEIFMRLSHHRNMSRKRKVHLFCVFTDHHIIVNNILFFKLSEVHLHVLSIRGKAFLTFLKKCAVLPIISHPLWRKVLINLHTVRFLLRLFISHFDAQGLHTVVRWWRLRILNLWFLTTQCLLLLRASVKTVSALESTLLEEGMLQQTDVKGRYLREVRIRQRALVN